MAKVKVGPDVELHIETLRWLAMNDPLEPYRVEAERQSERIIEVSLDRLRNKAIDYTDILIQDIDEYDLWDCDTVSAEQYLGMGTIQRVGEDYIYRQGVIVRG